MMQTLALASTLFAVAHCGTVTWTGIIGDQQWTTANNWLPATVPGVHDHVVIDDAEMKDATVILTSPQIVKSLSMGNGAANVHFRQLAALNVTGTTDMGKKTVFEVNSGAAAFNSPDVSVEGELEFICGSLTGNFTITGYANFGGQPAKQLIDATIKVKSTQKVMIAGAIQFSQSSSVEANTAVVSRGGQCALTVVDTSKKNSFVAKGFSWTQTA